MRRCNISLFPAYIVSDGKEIVITPNRDNEVQMDFTKTFKAKSGIELYEHIIVREENGAQCVYTIMNESCFEILKKLYWNSK